MLFEKAYMHLGIKRFADVKDDLMKALNSVNNYKKNDYTPIPNKIKKSINSEWKFAFDAFGYELDESKD